MYKLNKIVAGSLILLFFIFSVARITDAKEFKLLPNAEFVPGEFIVKIKSGASISDLGSIHYVRSSEKILAQHKVKGAVAKNSNAFGLDRLYVGTLENGVDLKDALQTLNNHPSVEYAEPNYLVHIAVTSNDPGLSQQWGMSKIQAPAAWDLTSTSNVVVGIIDTGIDYTHEDLAANMWKNAGEVPNNNIDDDGNGFIDDVFGWNFVANSNDPMDDHGHGTHVAGIVAAAGNNGIGVVGVNWTAKVSAIKFLSAGGRGSLVDAVRAIEYANMQGFKITNNSWGSFNNYQPLYDVIAAAGANGNLFIAAAGNSGNDADIFPLYPAAYNLPNIISVAATRKNDGLATFSNYGKISVDLGAPGVDIYSTLPRGVCSLCSSIGYGFLSGTSMASPHVAGAAALLWSYVPALSHLGVKDRLLGSTDVNNNLKRKTVSGGRLNVYNALINLVHSFTAQ